MKRLFANVLLADDQLTAPRAMRARAKTDCAASIWEKGIIHDHPPRTTPPTPPSSRGWRTWRTFARPLDPTRYAATLKLALAKAKISKPLRPFHDGRHTSITNAAAAGTSPGALQARAGHASFSTTQVYIDLAGEAFREEAELLERRLLGVEDPGRNLSGRATHEEEGNDHEEAV